MLVLRLQRIGKKHEPHYRLVVSEKREKLGAPPAEDLGSYNPKTKASTINKERAAYWLKQGAQPSATVHNLLVREGILSAPKVQFSFPIKAKEETKAAAEPVVQSTEPQPTEVEAAVPSDAEVMAGKPADGSA